MRQERRRWRASKMMQLRARELRRAMTPAEKRLWRYLRDEQLDGAHFRRQHAVGPYILDFFCAKAKLVVEVDGDIHADPEQSTYDAERTLWLNEQKEYRVIRFWNNEIFSSVEGVVETIHQALIAAK
jgi:very-short-patch-repair endonuclease